jgi:hypothetical protein
MKPRFFIFVLSLFTFASCEMIVKVDVPEVPSKLVVTSFISPQDTIWRVYVGQTEPVFSKKPSSSQLMNATIQMSDGSQTVTFPTDNSTGYYDLNIKQAPFTIQAGKTYYLTVKTVDGRQVKAQCTIPTTIVGITEVEITNNSNSFEPFRANIKWQDNAQENNFYRCFSYTKNYDNLAGGAIESYQQNFNYSLIMQKDTEKQGSSFSWRFDATQSRGYTDGKSRFLFILLNTDEAYFRYMTTRETASYSEGNPFAEPSPVYSNVEGGLGVFAGYQQYRVEVTK